MKVAAGKLGADSPQVSAMTHLARAQERLRPEQSGKEQLSRSAVHRQAEAEKIGGATEDDSKQKNLEFYLPEMIKECSFDVF